MHIIHQKLSFTVVNVLNIFTVHDLLSNDFCHKIKMYNFEPYTVLLAIATDIPVMTASVLQGHCNTVREE